MSKPASRPLRVLVPWLSCALLVACLAARPDVVAAQSSSGEAGAGQSETVTSSPSDDEYTVGANDVLQIRVSGREDIRELVTVDPSGKIQAPLIGAIDVAGKTPADLTDELSERYQLLDPTTTEALVSVARYGSRTLTFIGAVGTPGTIGFRELPDVWDALLAAGGALPGAELARVQVVRQDRAAGEPRTFRVNLSRGIEGTAPADLPELRPRDTIIVPQLDEATTAAEGYRLFGAVENPGSYSLSQASTLLDALAIAGGGNEEADLGSVRLTRRSPTGLMTFDIDVDSYLMVANPPMAFALREGDAITVPTEESFLARAGQVLGPLISILSLVVIINRSN